MAADIARVLFKNTVALTIFSAGQTVGNIILFFYLSRYLHPGGLGIYSTILTIYSTVSLGCGIGLNSLIPRELPKDLSLTNRYFIHGSLVSAGVALVLMLGLDLMVPRLNYLPETRTGVLIVSLALLAESLQVVLNSIFISHQKAEFIAVSGLLSVVGRIALSLIFMNLGFGVLSLVGVFVVFNGLAVLVNLYFLWRFVSRPHWEFDWPFMRAMLCELKVFAGLAILNALCSQSEVLILSLTRGEVQVGYYSGALKLVTIWVMVPNSYLTTMFPVLSSYFQESHQKALDLQNKSFKYLLAAALPLSVGMCITAAAIIPIFLGPGYDESVGPLRLLSWYLPLIFVNNLLWRVLIVRAEQKVVFRWQLLTEILQAALAIGLTPKFGPQGAALALLGGNLAYGATLTFFLRNKAPLPLLRIGWRFVLASLVMGAFTWLGFPYVNFWLLVAAAVILYAAMLLWLKAFSKEDLGLLKQLLPRSGKQPVHIVDVSTEVPR